jgi:hypothetical protein
MALGFQISAGTVPGRLHLGTGNLLNGKNNQDSYEVVLSDDCIVALVLDGCGSGRHSEIGSKIGGRLLSQAIVELARSGALSTVASPDSALDIMERLRRRTLLQLRQIASSLSIGVCPHDVYENCACDFKSFIREFFLFTIVGLIVTEGNTIVFSIGDGLYALNGELHEVGPYEHNAPPYLAYSFFENSYGDDASLRFKVHELIETKDLETAMIATDGLCDLLKREKHLIPGKSRSVGHISQVFSDDRFYVDANSEALTPWLRQLNSEVVKFNTQKMSIERHPGLLPDDTTVIALRRN